MQCLAETWPEAEQVQILEDEDPPGPTGRRLSHTWNLEETIQTAHPPRKPRSAVRITSGAAATNASGVSGRNPSGPAGGPTSMAPTAAIMPSTTVFDPSSSIVLWLAMYKKTVSGRSSTPSASATAASTSAWTRFASLSTRSDTPSTSPTWRIFSAGAPSPREPREDHDGDTCLADLVDDGLGGCVDVAEHHRGLLGDDGLGQQHELHTDPGLGPHHLRGIDRRKIDRDQVVGEAQLPDDLAEIAAE